MKKMTLCLLALGMLLSLTACGGETTESSTESASTASAQTAEETASAETASDETAAAETPAETEAAETETPAVEETAFTEITAVDNEYCTVKITELDPDNMWGYTLKVYLENKSADTTYMYSVDAAAVNGVETDPLFATEVAPGMKSNDSINFLDSGLEEYGIGEITDIELSFRVYDTDDWTAEPVAKETVHVYPQGEENATVFVRESQPTDTVLVDNDSVTVIVTGYEDDSIFGYTANLYLVNKTDQELLYSVDDVSVNGFMADPFWAASVQQGKCYFTSMSWSDSTLEENGITSVEEINLQLHVKDYDDLLSDYLVDESVTLNP